MLSINIKELAMISKDNQMKYESTAVRKTNKTGLRVLDEMGTGRIIAHICYKHRVGLLALGNIGFIISISYDKLHWLW